MLLACMSCSRKSINPRISLWHQDKIPYGTWFAYQSLFYLYPDTVDIVIQKMSPEIFMASDDSEGFEDDSIQKKPELYLSVSRNFFASDAETENLLNYVKNGNHLVIAALEFSSDLLDTLKIDVSHANIASSTDTVLYMARSGNKAAFESYGYPGFTPKQFFEIKDSSQWVVLGKNHNGFANCIRMQLDSGTITLHANPLQFTNFFLLHKNNHRIWSSLLEGLPSEYSTIWWDNYFRNWKKDTDSFSSLGVFMKYPSLKWGLYTILIMLILLLFSEMKRRTKPIPVLSPVENSSLDFVKTIGRLYLQHRDNVDLARKMESHFRDFIRHQYNLSGQVPDTELAGQLSLKSGVDQELIKSILSEFRMIDEHGAVSDGDLLHINELIEQFHIKRS